MHLEQLAQHVGTLFPPRFHIHIDYETTCVVGEKPRSVINLHVRGDIGEGKIGSDYGLKSSAEVMMAARKIARENGFVEDAAEAVEVKP